MSYMDAHVAYMAYVLDKLEEDWEKEQEELKKQQYEDE